jgi:hypothetical protein
MAKSKLPEDFAVTESMRYWARSHAPGVLVDRETEAFCDYWRGNGRQMVDWVATWRNWMRRAKPTHRAPPRPSPEPIQEDPYTGDVWDVRANFHLLKFVRKFRVPGVPASFRGDDASKEFRQNVQLLVDFKNAWARDCREADPPPSAQQQREWWVECMKRARSAFVGEVWRPYERT